MKARPVTPPLLIEELADRIVNHQPGQWLRVAVDGASAADPTALASALVSPIRARGRAAIAIRAADFLRPASVRLEAGHTDPDSYYEQWLDTAGLRREVLDRLTPGGSGEILPSLWDVDADRATRVPYVTLPAGGVVLVSGELLLGRELPFDLTLHLALSTAALVRRSVVAQRWALPAFERYETEVAPSRIADVVVRVDDAHRPAIVG